MTQEIERRFNTWDILRPKEVFFNGSWETRFIVIDGVLYTVDCTAEYVRESLINHDGYPSDIKVRLHK